MSDAILAIDLGGTHCRTGVADGTSPADVRATGNWAAPADLGAFLALVESQLRTTGATRLGLGIPGLARGSVCTWVPNLGYLDGLDLAASFPSVTVGLGNDAQLALLAEATAGVATGLSDAILLAVGTGIGSAVLAGGEIIAGSSGAACSFGWAAADVSDPGEDRSGWLERHASGRALDEAASSIGLPDGAALVAAIRDGDELAREAAGCPMRALGTALAGAVALLDPATVILAGGVASSLDVLGPLILEPLRRQLPPHLRGITLTAGRFGPGAGLIGAAIAGARGPGWRRLHG